MTTKTVMIIYTKNQVLEGRDIIRNTFKNKKVVVIVALNAETHYALKDENISHRNVDDYLDNDTFSNLDLEAINLARNWYKQEPFANLVDYEGISLGRLTEFSFSNYFSYVIESIKEIECIIEKERPGEMIVFDDWDGDMGEIRPEDYENVPCKVVTLLGKRNGISVEDIKIDRSQASKSTLNILKGLRKKILMLAGKTFVTLIDTISSHKKKVRRNVLYSYPWSYVRSIVMELDDTRAVFRGFYLDLIKENFLQILKGDISLSPFFARPSKAASRKSQEYLEKVRHEWQKIKRDFGHIDYQKYDLGHIVENKLEYAFFNYFPNLIERLELAAEIIKKKKIDLVLVSSPTEESHRIFIEAAKKLGIKTLFLQHGVAGNIIGFLPPISADKCATWGEEGKRWLRSIGVDEEKIVVTGFPKFDSYIEREIPSREELYQKLHIESNKKIIVLATHHFERSVTMANLLLIGMEWYNFFSMVIESVKLFPDYQLVVKLHPNDEETEIHKSMLREISSKPIPVFQKQEELPALLNVCDIWINYPSTTALEAMILGKPVITIIPEGKEIRNDCYLEAGICVKSADELKSAIEKIIWDDSTKKELIKNQETFISEHAYIQDGNASKRVADLIEQMVEESKEEKNAALAG